MLKQTKKSTVKSKPSERKMLLEFDMSPACKVLNYPDFEGFPEREDNKLTRAILKNTVDAAQKFGLCAWYSNSTGLVGDADQAVPIYTACHAGLHSDYKNSWYLDLVIWSKLSQAQKPMAKKIYKMLVSKDSPWADALENAYILWHPEEDRLLGIYVDNFGKDIPKGCFKLFINLMIAIRCVSEHRYMRDAWKEKVKPTKTFLGWFVFLSGSNGYGHDWPHIGARGKSWVKKLFSKQHDLSFYKGADSISSYCNSVFHGDKDHEGCTLEMVTEVEKERNYAEQV